MVMQPRVYDLELANWLKSWLSLLKAGQHGARELIKKSHFPYPQNRDNNSGAQLIELGLTLNKLINKTVFGLC